MLSIFTFSQQYTSPYDKINSSLLPQRNLFSPPEREIILGCEGDEV